MKTAFLPVSITTLIFCLIALSFLISCNKEPDTPKIEPYQAPTFNFHVVSFKEVNSTSPATIFEYDRNNRLIKTGDNSFYTYEGNNIKYILFESPTFGLIPYNFFYENDKLVKFTWTDDGFVNGFRASTNITYDEYGRRKTIQSDQPKYGYLTTFEYDNEHNLIKIESDSQYNPNDVSLEIEYDKTLPNPIGYVADIVFNTTEYVISGAEFYSMAGLIPTPKYAIKRVTDTKSKSVVADFTYKIEANKVTRTNSVSSPMFGNLEYTVANK